MSKNIENKYVATMVLHAIGDTIGFKNGEWEFFPNNSSYDSVLEKLYAFVDLGGINLIDLQNWMVSDDTILHIAIGKSLILHNEVTQSSIEKITVQQLIKSRMMMENDSNNGVNRYIGNAVNKHILMLQNGDDWNKFKFDKFGGGNGAAMRSNCIGLAYFGEENRSKLIEYSINSSKMTHVNPIGWLGGFSTALFTAFAIESVNLNNWIPSMLQLIETRILDKYLDKTDENEVKSFNEFVQVWKMYYEARFLNGVPTKTKSHTNIIQRLVFYNNLFGENNMSRMGLSGYSGVIVAYDCLIDSGNNWEKLVIYSMINNFDSDTIGAIAGGLFGTLYGFENVPEKNLAHLEFKDKLIKIGKLLYKKYYKREKLQRI